MGVKKGKSKNAYLREQGLSKKQMNNAYRNYLERYNRQKEKMIRKGTYMHDDILTYEEYKATRRAFIEEQKAKNPDKKVININQSIVSAQQYEFSMEQAKGLREAGKDLGLDLSEESLMKLRGGRDIRNEDLSLINNALKEKYPALSGIERSKWITEHVFGDSE
jgi:hypothetical protein